MIGIISDTHENEEAIRKAVAIFKEKNVDFVVHCGDIISPPVLKNFTGLDVRFVFGNNDGERNGLNKMAKMLGFEEIADEKEFTFKGRNFYVYHGTDPEKLDDAIKSDKYDYVLTGHTHLKRDDRVLKTRVINPGALFQAEPFTVALIDPEKEELEFVEVK